MRSANAVEPDWSEDTATLIYNSPEREEQDPPFSIAPRETMGRRHTYADGPVISIAKIATTVVAALIGAMAGAWTVAQQGLGEALPAVERVAARATPPRVDDGVRIAAAAPQPSAPTPTAPEVNSGAEAAPEPPDDAPPAAAPEENAGAGAAPEPPDAPSAVAAVDEVDAPLEPQPAKAAKTAARERRKQPTAARARPSHVARSRPAAARSAPAPVHTTPAPQPTAARMGLLRINSRPWSKVFVDNRPAGATPQTAIEVTPGRHRITLVSDEFGLRRTLTVEVRAGETVSRSVELLQ